MFVLNTQDTKTLLAAKSRDINVDTLTRIGIGRDDDTLQLLWRMDTCEGPLPDGFKELDQSLYAIVGNNEVAITQNQNVFDALDMSEDEVAEVGDVLELLHKTGVHIATFGVTDNTYDKNVDILVREDGATTWTRYNATKFAGVEGFQLLENDEVGVRTNGRLGAKSIDAFVGNVMRGENIAFEDGTAIDCPAGATLPPRMVNKNGRLALSFVDRGETTIATADGEGNLRAATFTRNDDVVGPAMLPFGTLTDGATDGKLGMIVFDPKTGVGTLKKGIAFNAAFRTVETQPSAK